MKITIRTVLPGLLICIAMLSCEDLDQAPISSITVENFYKTESDARAAINAMYADLTSHYLYNQFSEVVQSQGTDDAEWGGGRNTSNAGKNEIDKFIFSSETIVIQQFWTASYNVVNSSNVAIQKIAGMNINEERKNQVLGEAYFIRGLMYFNLVRLFGKVPLLTEPTSSLEQLEVARTEVEVIYEQIINDFATAAQNLPVTPRTEELGIATKGAALTLLTKVYLTRKNYAKAISTAEEAINLNVYSLWPNYSDIFNPENENRGESIFEIQYLGGGGQNPGSSFAWYMRPPSMGGYGDNPVTKNHYDVYRAGDLRRDVNVFKDPNAPATVAHPYYVKKYAEIGPTPESGGDNYIITRYADLLLMYAEALSQLNPDDPNAYNAFNKVRRRAFGYPVDLTSPFDLPSGLTKEQFEDSVLYERRRELAFEGHRRFDLLRTGKLKEAMNAQNPSINVMDRHILLPIPAEERLLNPLLGQNDGY